MKATMARRGAALVACLFLASGIVVDAQQLTGVYDLKDIRLIDLTKTTFNLTCNVADSVPPNAVVNWLKEDNPVSNTTLKDRYHVTKTGNVAVLTIKPVNENDYGQYSCRLQDNPAEFAMFRVMGTPHVRISPNHNVVEAQKIKMVCNVLGKPMPEVAWVYNDGSGSGNVTVETNDRITLSENEAKVKNAMLVLTEAQPTDAGSYTCRATQPEGNVTHEDTTVLRVKDKYAALWPFIGICAEVVVLCAVILVYEKRRTKSGDMDDSDTDNHDQKKS